MEKPGEHCKWLPSQVWLSKVGLVLDLTWKGQNFRMLMYIHGWYISGFMHPFSCWLGHRQLKIFAFSSQAKTRSHFWKSNLGSLSYSFISLQRKSLVFLYFLVPVELKKHSLLIKDSKRICWCLQKYFVWECQLLDITQFLRPKINNWADKFSDNILDINDSQTNLFLMNHYQIVEQDYK